MNAVKLIPVLCAFSLLAGSVFAEVAGAKMRPHRGHVSDRYYWHKGRRERTLRRIKDFQRYRQDRRDPACFSPPYFRCSESNGD